MVSPAQQFGAPNPVGAFAYTPLGFFQLVAGVVQTTDALVMPSIRGLQGDVQSLFCDASLAPNPVTITNELTRQYVIFPAGSLGWMPFLLQMPGRIQMRCASTCEIALGVASSVVAPGVISENVVKSSDTEPTRSDITASTTSQTILAANVLRQGASIYNESGAYLYLLMGSGTASATNYSVRMEPFSYFETPYKYGRAITGVWSSASGGARVTEYL